MATEARNLRQSIFRKEGDYWTIVHEGQAIRLKDAKGLHCLRRLLENPGREFHASDLVNTDGSPGSGPSGEAGAGDLGDAGALLDDRAKTEYRRRLEELKDELEEAERFNDAGRASAAREEIEAITAELAAGVGLGGRDRPAASHAERARVTVTQRLRSSLEKLRESHPSLGRHLAASVKTGYFCSYAPDPADAIVWNGPAGTAALPTGSGVGSAEEPPVPTHAPRQKRLPTPFLAIAEALVLVAGAYAMRGWLAPASSNPSLPYPDKPSIAILPFANLTGDATEDAFSTGLTEGLIADASKLSGLFVIARDSVAPYAGKPVNVGDVGRALGVEHVLEGDVRYVVQGSVRKAGDAVRISARLWEAASGRQIWAERYDRRREESFAVEDEILQQIVGDLEVHVAGAELDRIRTVPTQSLTAYESYLRGVDLARQCTVAAVTEARHMLERAIDLDASFAAAHAELGLLAVGETFGPVAVDKLCSGLYASDRDSRWPVLVPVVSRLGALADRAMTLDDSLPAAHLLRAFVEPGTPRAIAEAERAVRLGPSDARVHALSAAVYSTAARSDEAIRLLEKATRLNPRHPDWYSFHLGRAYTLAHRDRDAASALAQLALAYPDFLWAHTELAAIYQRLGRVEEANAEKGAIRRIYPASAEEWVPQVIEDPEADEEPCSGEDCVAAAADLAAAAAAFAAPRRPTPTVTDRFFRLQ